MGYQIFNTYSLYNTILKSRRNSLRWKLQLLLFNLKVRRSQEPSINGHNCKWAISLKKKQLSKIMILEYLTLSSQNLKILS